MPGFDYFVVRTRRGVADTLAGLAERLGTGEKRSFESGEQLLRLLERWSGVTGNMPAAGASGNTTRTGVPLAEPGRPRPAEPPQTTRENP